MIRNDEQTIIHYVTDSTYIETLISYIRKYYPEQKHKYYLISNSDIKQIKENRDYVEIISGSNYNIMKQTRAIMKKYKNSLVILHFLDRYKILALITKKNSQTVYWRVWGADLYDRIEYELYDEDTIELIHYKKNNNKFKKKLLNLIRNLLFKKIDYVGIDNEQYEIMKKFYNIKKCTNQLLYPIKEETKKDDHSINEEQKTKNGHFGDEKRILLGNSGDPANNHVSALKKLAGLNLDYKVLVPLSYGNDEYVRKVMEIGKKLLGDKFVSITEFMDKKSYSELLSSVDIAIFNHRRQQARGNIRMLVDLGKKIYLNPVNVIYKQYCNLGIKVENFNECVMDESIFAPYCIEVYDKNKRLMEKLYGEDEIKKNMDLIFLEGKV